MSEHQTAEVPSTKSGALISGAVFLLALAFAAFLRFHLIGIKPLHHDEGVNSFFLLRLYREGQYAYDPNNYHGPTLYYFALVALYLFGEVDLALRFWPALFGALSVLLLWPLRRWLGLVGTPVAAWLVALSPGLVYFSRDFIHEMPFGFFTLGIVACGWRYAATRKFAYLAGLAAFAGLLFATKETAIITAVVLVLAALCAAVWDIGRRLVIEHRFSLGSLLEELWAGLRNVWPPLDPLLSAVIIFIFINVIFYSSFFSHWKGVVDAGKSVMLWAGRGVSGREHYHSPQYYFGILMKLELPLAVGAMLGGLVALWRGTRFGLFLLAWSAGIVLAYTLIDYKTPWLMVSMLLPLALLSGYAAEEMFSLLPSISLRLVWGAILLAIFISCARMAARVNFEKYDDNTNSSGYLKGLGTRVGLMAYKDEQYGGYVYAQTDREALKLVRAIREAADRLPMGKSTGILIAPTNQDYWPLPWYLRDHNQVAYVGGLPATITQPIVIVKAEQEAEVEPKLGADFTSSNYLLRPGVNLILYAQK